VFEIAVALEFQGVPPRNCTARGRDSRRAHVRIQRVLSGAAFGGMKQRRCRSRADEPANDILLMDEPFAALDEPDAHGS